ncbi:MAG: TetR/AcrR family transcriptional regulator [Alphaproteobacteria bacterium]
MARPREFEESAVLSEAVSLFWEHGFDHATVQDIAARTGVRVGSLYAAFGSKRDLYLRIVDHYIETVSQQVIRRLTEPPSGLAAIRAYFAALTAGILDGDRRWGCLITNAVIVQAGTDPDIAAKIETHLRNVEAAFRTALQAASKQGEIPPGTDADAMAAFLTCVVQGLNVLAKTRPSRERIEAIVGAALTALAK